MKGWLQPHGRRCSPPNGELIFTRFAVKWASLWVDCNWLTSGGYVQINEEFITAMPISVLKQWKKKKNFQEAK